MPNVNALKKFAKKKVNNSELAKSVKNNAKKNINRLKIKQRTEKYAAEQELYNKLSRFNGNVRNSVVFNPVMQRLLAVKPLPMSVKKSIKKSSPSERTKRRQTAKAGAIVLARKGIPLGPAQNIIDRLIGPLTQRQRR